MITSWISTNCRYPCVIWKNAEFFRLILIIIIIFHLFRGSMSRRCQRLWSLGQQCSKSFWKMIWIVENSIVWLWKVDWFLGEHFFIFVFWLFCQLEQLLWWFWELDHDISLCHHCSCNIPHQCHQLISSSLWCIREGGERRERENFSFLFLIILFAFVDLVDIGWSAGWDHLYGS